ncbi:unnamed protein product [Polarella glacialis]|uniref:Uncharacterized protein n=1 Tax=Polarella glacialis TaxID=89957 RepID=A0A813F3H9_POLGL|nr:unnamed protein product [Polarella glacialis]
MTTRTTITAAAAEAVDVAMAHAVPPATPQAPAQALASSLPEKPARLNNVDLVIVRCKDAVGGGRKKRFGKAEDPAWDVMHELGEMFREVHLVNKCNGTKPMWEFIPGRVFVHSVENTGKEEFGYFEILRYKYPNYATWTVFLQADDTDPNRQVGCLRQNFSEEVEKQGYASLGGVYVSKRRADVTANAKTFEEVSKIWQRSVPVAASAVSQLQNGRSTASFYANADFMVHKRLLLKVEPEVWKDFQDVQRIKTAKIGFRIGFAFEATWHIIWEAIARGGVRTPSLHQASYPLDFSCGIYDCERTPTCKGLADKLVRKKKARR